MAGTLSGPRQGVRALVGRRRWARPVRPHSFGAPLAELSDRAVRTESLLRAFYAFFPFWFAVRLEALLPLLEPRCPDYAWPVAWMHLTGPSAAPVVLGFGLAAAVLAAALPELRATRVALAVGLLEVLALKYSYGKVHHLMHGWLYAALIFGALLPSAAFRSREASRKCKATSVLVLHAATAMLALTYSLAGLGKLFGTAYQLGLGQITPLHPSALARHVADRLLQTYPDSALGPFMIEHGALLWPLMLATLYLQLVAFPVTFRPRLLRPWGFGLVGFHLVTGLSMTIDFSPNVLLVGLLFLASPFAPRRTELVPALLDLPILGDLARWVARRSGGRTA